MGHSYFSFVPVAYDSMDPGTSNPTETEMNDDQTRLSEQNSNANRPRSQSDAEEEDEVMQYGAQHVVKIFTPVTLCMFVVVLTVASVNYYTDQSDGVYLVYTPFHPEADDKASQTVVKSIYNALIVLAVIVVMTTVLVVLYKYRCYKIIHGWLILSSLLLLFLFSYIYADAILRAYNTPFDYFTLAVCIWNFGCMGMLSMHWKAPLRIQQAYHIIVSALLALVFIKYLPEWTLWMILGVIAIWDLVAVLCPHGPLRMLVNIAHERNENIFPSLIYSSTVAYTYGMADTSSDSAEGTRIPAASNAPPESTADRPLRTSSAWSNRENYQSTDDRGVNGDEANADQATNPEAGRRPADSEPEDDEEKGVKLGLGDFIFYSVLVGKASSSGDWNTTIAAFIAILMGLFFTLMLLAVFRKALPALPISIAFGLVFNFGTQYVITPFTTDLAAGQIFL